MKVVCIDEDVCNYNDLTIFKPYEVIEVTKIGNYIIKDNTGYIGPFFPSFFKSLEDFRNEKIELLGI